MSATLAANIGADMYPYCLKVVHGGSLDEVEKIAKMSVAVSANTILELTDVIVIRDLSHPLNLGLRFLKEF